MRASPRLLRLVCSKVFKSLGMASDIFRWYLACALSLANARCFCGVDASFFSALSRLPEQFRRYRWQKPRCPSISVRELRKHRRYSSRYPAESWPLRFSSSHWSCSLLQVVKHVCIGPICSLMPLYSAHFFHAGHVVHRDRFQHVDFTFLRAKTGSHCTC